MAIISISKIKEIAEKNSETHIINLGRIDKKLEGVNIPIKVKTFEETLKLKNDFKLKKEKLTIEYKPFTRLPTAMKEIIMKDGGYRKGMTENTYYQLIKLNEDEDKIERMKYRERLFNVLIHLDMDYKTDDNKTLWEDSNLSKGDYNGLIDLFSGIIQYETHIDLLELIIDSIRNGAYEDKDLDQVVNMYSIRKYLDTLNEDERKEFFDNLSKIKNISEEIENNVKKANDE